MNKIELKPLTYEKLDNNIHMLIFNQNKRQTIDDMFDVIDQVYKTEDLDHMLYFLIDASNITEFPFRYMGQKTQDWRNQYTHIPTGRSAILWRQNPLMMILLNQIIGIFNNKESITRIFDPEKRQEAIDWLISE